MAHRDALLAAQERIQALERALEEAEARAGETTDAAIARLEREVRALAAERDRLRVERTQLVDDLTVARTALAEAQAELRAMRDVVARAKAMRDQLRVQAIEQAVRTGAARKRSR